MNDGTKKYLNQCHFGDVRTVLRIPAESYKGAHFATLPRKLVEPCILAGSPRAAWCWTSSSAAVPPAKLPRRWAASGSASTSTDRMSRCRSRGCGSKDCNSDDQTRTLPTRHARQGLALRGQLEQVEQSETWLRARSGMTRGALLLLWHKAWMQTPCGSLPNDDELIALLLDMEDEEFQSRKPEEWKGSAA